jgi:uncharacterized membrane protein
MLIELFALLGAIGIALILFITVTLLGDKPARAFIVVMALMYLLITIYIYLMNMISKYKEEKRAADPHEG